MIATDLFELLPDAARAALAPAVARIEAILGKAAPAKVYDRPRAETYDAFRFIQAHEAWAMHGGWVETRRPILGAHIADRVTLARSTTDAQVAAARAVRESFATHLDALYADGGVMIAPVLTRRGAEARRFRSRARRAIATTRWRSFVRPASAACRNSSCPRGDCGRRADRHIARRRARLRPRVAAGGNENRARLKLLPRLKAAGRGRSNT